MILRCVLLSLALLSAAAIGCSDSSTPATLAGQPVAVYFHVVINFRLV